MTREEFEKLYEGRDISHVVCSLPVQPDTRKAVLRNLEGHFAYNRKCQMKIVAEHEVDGDLVIVGEADLERPMTTMEIKAWTYGAGPRPIGKAA